MNKQPSAESADPPTPTPRAGGRTWAPPGKKGRQPLRFIPLRFHPPTLGGPSPSSTHKPLTGTHAAFLPRPGQHPSPAKPPDTTCSGAPGRPAQGWGRAAGPRRSPLEAWGGGVGGERKPLRPLPTFPPFQPEPARSPSPANFSPTHTTPWTRNSKFAFRGFARPSGNFVRSPSGWAQRRLSFSLSLLLFLSLFCLFFSSTLPPESCWALSLLLERSGRAPSGLP